MGVVSCQRLRVIFGQDVIAMQCIDTEITREIWIRTTFIWRRIQVLLHGQTNLIFNYALLW